ncbi:MAG: hypothetical protein ABSE07_01285 [Methanoregula sp.]
MTRDFCTDTSRKIRKFGYARKPAIRLARVILSLQVSVCGLMGVYELLSQVENNRNAGSGKWFSGARAGIVSPAFFARR